MPKLTVCITLDTDNGQVTVGLEPQGEEMAEQGGAPAKQPVEAQAQALLGGGQPGAPAEEEGQMQPVASVDEALQVAKQLLTQGQGDGQQAPNADADMQKGFGGNKPTSMMGRQGGMAA